MLTSFPKTIWPKLLISALTVAFILFVVSKGIDLQPSLVALVVIAILPWLAALIDTMELPGGTKLKFKDIQKKVDEQEKKLRLQQETIAKLVVYSLAGYIFDHLAAIYHASRSGGEYLFRRDPGMERDLRFLREHGYLEVFHIADLRDGENLARRLKLTPAGVFLVELREQRQREDVAETARHLV